MKKILSFVVAASVVLLAGSALAGPGGTNRPFKGTGSGVTIVTATENELVFSSATEGTIIATHLGKGLYSIAATQDWSGATWPDDPCAVVAGTFEFTAANGATVNGTVAGTTCEVTPFLNTTYSSNLNLTITGGTGRFTGATGALTITGTSTATTLGPFADVFSVTGTISY